MRDSFFAVSFCTSYAPYPFIKEENSNNMVGGCASSFFLPFAFCDFGSDGSNCEEPPLPPTTGGIFRYYGFLTPSFFLPFTFFEYGSRLEKGKWKNAKQADDVMQRMPRSGLFFHLLFANSVQMDPDARSPHFHRRVGPETPAIR